MDLIVLAESDGTVDMTLEAISGVTRVPLDDLKSAISILEKPDPQSRTPDEQGARIVRLDEHRNWGWRIVNYEKYRLIRSTTDRKTYMRNLMREKRKGEKLAEVLTPANTVSSSPSPSASLFPEERGVGKGDKNGFQKPTIEQCRVGATQRGMPTTEGEKFFHHFESNGWKVGGKAPMRSWTSALSNWASRYQERPFPSTQPRRTRLEDTI